VKRSHAYSLQKAERLVAWSPRQTQCARGEGKDRENTLRVQEREIMNLYIGQVSITIEGDGHAAPLAKSIYPPALSFIMDKLGLRDADYFRAGAANTAAHSSADPIVAKIVVHPAHFLGKLSPHDQTSGRENFNLEGFIAGLMAAN
jgi:hypothetical protein